MNESHSTSDNQSNDSSNKELTPKQAEDVVYDWYKNQGFGNRLRNEFNYNPSKSTDEMYYIDYAASDAYGTGTPYVAIVDKHTGSIVDNYNNMTDEEKAKRKQMNESKLEQSNRQRNNDVQNNETKNDNETQHTSSNEENQNSAQSETQNDVQTSNQSENNDSTPTDASTQTKEEPTTSQIDRNEQAQPNHQSTNNEE